MNLEESKVEQREDWVDILRGLSVFLVILGHLYTGYLYHLVVNPVKMPLFYFLAGYVMKQGMPLKNVIFSRLRTLFIPLFVFSLFPVRAFYYLFVLKNTQTFNSYLLGFADGSINWFIYSFFVSSVLFYVICRGFKNRGTAIGIVSLLCFVIGVLTKDIKWMSIWSINTALTGILFLYMGSAFKSMQQKVMSKRSLPFLCGVTYVLLIAFSYIYYPGKVVNFHLIKYYNVPLVLCLTVSGILFLIKLTQLYCDKTNGLIKRWLCVFGRNTLVIYLFSGTLNAVVLMIYRNFLGVKSPGLILCLTGTAFSCILGTLLSETCRRYAPFLLGIKAKHNPL